MRRVKYTTKHHLFLKLPFRITFDSFLIDKNSFFDVCTAKQISLKKTREKSISSHVSEKRFRWRRFFSEVYRHKARFRIFTKTNEPLNSAWEKLWHICRPYEMQKSEGVLFKENCPEPPVSRTDGFFFERSFEASGVKLDGESKVFNRWLGSVPPRCHPNIEIFQRK